MSDGLTPPTRSPSAPSPAHPVRSRRPARVVVPLQALAVLVLFAGVGALAGLLWFRLWTPPTGVVSDQQWFTDETGLRQDFAGTGWYVAIAAVAGLVLGVLCAFFLDRAEVVTLAAVVVGSVLAAFVMYRVGTHLSPPDPDVLAKTAEEGVRLDGALRVAGWTPRAAFPFGAVVGVMSVYFLTGGRVLPTRDEAPPGSSPA